MKKTIFFGIVFISVSFLVLPFLQAVPAHAQGGLVPDCGYDRDAPGTPGYGIIDSVEACQLCDAFVMFETVMDFVVILSFSIGALILLVGGVMYLTSAGRETTLTRAKEILKAAGLGLIIILTAWIMVNFFFQLVGVANPNPTGIDFTKWWQFSCPRVVVVPPPPPGANQPPVAVVSYNPINPAPGTPVIFSSVGSNDPDGTIVSYSWSFGDGDTSDQADPPAHIYGSEATYAVILTVTDNLGATGSASVLVSVSSPLLAPTFSFTADPNPIPPGESSTLTWKDVTNVDSCSASGGWSGAKSISGTNTETVTPGSTTTYNLFCSGPGGSLSKSVTVTVDASLLPPAGLRVDSLQVWELDIFGAPIKVLDRTSVASVANEIRSTLTVVDGAFLRIDYETSGSKDARVELRQYPAGGGDPFDTCWNSSDCFMFNAGLYPDGSSSNWSTDGSSPRLFTWYAVPFDAFYVDSGSPPLGNGNSCGLNGYIKGDAISTLTSPSIAGQPCQTFVIDITVLP